MTPRPALLLLFVGVLAAAGCASEAASPSPSPPATSAVPSATSTPGSPAGTSPSGTPDRVKGKEISVAVKNGKVSPKPHRVKVTKDTRVRLLVVSDVDDAVHVHGYEIEKDLPAGQQVTVNFVADQAGLFEVETHESELTLLQLEVR